MVLIGVGSLRRSSTFEHLGGGPETEVGSQRVFGNLQLAVPLHMQGEKFEEAGQASYVRLGEAAGRFVAIVITLRVSRPDNGIAT